MKLYIKNHRYLSDMTINKLKNKNFNQEKQKPSSGNYKFYKIWRPTKTFSIGRLLWGWSPPQFFNATVND